jgi:hypothetical protein
MRLGVRELSWGDRSRPYRVAAPARAMEWSGEGSLEWGDDPMARSSARADHVSASRVPALSTRRTMSTTQLIIVAVLSLAVVALLMVRQRQTD